MAAFPFDYELPSHLIAQEPANPRDHARLLVVHRTGSTLEHRRFDDLPDLLAPGDLLVLNDTRVLPARLIGKRAATGGKWEGLFLRDRGDGTWEMLCQTRGHLRPGERIHVERIHVEPGLLELELTAKLPEGRWQVRPLAGGAAVDLLERFGRIPLPPYIRQGVAHSGDRIRYQTVYAREPGAAAAPTAGLHFTPAVFERLRKRGIECSFVTLHVGLGTFRPIEADDFTRHPMHSEWGRLPGETANAITACRARGGRVIAVGTTAVRVLETAARVTRPESAKGVGESTPFANSGCATQAVPWSGETELFIYPPYEFRVVDALITNFHLPRTTLLLLVAAFAGVEVLRTAYHLAIADGYRFYSYGDAMIILP
jgi:S-adenosylmethionine:tRNA ribosyltransferase-isomerase